MRIKERVTNSASKLSSLVTVLIKNSIKEMTFYPLIIFVISSLFKSIFNNNIFMYVGFIILIGLKLSKYYRNKYNNSTIGTSIILYSFILPDNYTIIVTSVIVFIYMLIENKNEIKINVNKKIMYLLVGYLLANIVFNKIGFVKIGFWLLFNVTFIIYFIMFRYREVWKIETEVIGKDILNLLIIQVFATLFIVIFDFNVVKSDFAGDWSVGTFGANQGNILAIFMSFLAIMYLNKYLASKSNKDLGILILTSILAFSTFSLVNIVILLVTLVINFTVILYKKGDTKKIYQYILIILAVLISFYIVSPEWVKNDVKNFTSIKYVEQRVRKLEAYEETYYKIPKQDFKYLLIGNGLGNYSSRAALTTTGYYIGAYNKIFTPQISKYTQDVVVERLYSDYARDHQHIYASVLGTPFSSWITIMGEWGLIGVLLVVLGIISLFKLLKTNQRMILIYFILICLFDNWIEYAKIALLFWLFMYGNRMIREVEDNG